MKTFRLIATPVIEVVPLVGGNSLISKAYSRYDDSPRAVVEAANVKALAPLFDQFAKDCAATGKAYECCVMLANPRERKPPGFDAARENGGALHRYVNLDSVRKQPEVA